jgi:hypothetical protein
MKVVGVGKTFLQSAGREDAIAEAGIEDRGILDAARVVAGERHAGRAASTRERRATVALMNQSGYMANWCWSLADM